MRDAVMDLIIGALLVVGGTLLGLGFAEMDYNREVRDLEKSVVELQSRVQPVSTPGPLDFRVTMNGTWVYTCTEMEWVGESGPDEG